MASKTDIENFYDPSITIDYKDVLTGLFNSNLIGAAYTDAWGNIVSANARYGVTMGVWREENPLSLTYRVSPIVLAETLLKYDLPIGDHATLTLCRRTLPAEAQEGTYLWLVANTAPAPAHTLDHKEVYYSFAHDTFEMVFCTSLEDRILFGNHIFYQALQLPQETPENSNSVITLFHDPQDYEMLKQKVLRLKRLTRERVYFQKVNGHRITGLVNCSLQQTATGTLVINWTVLDISKRVVDEDDLQSHNSKLAKVNAQMEKLLYSASHDLRSPLTSIFGLANLLRIDSSDPIVTQYALKIEQCTDKLDSIIQDIIGFSKATYQNSSSEPVDFEHLLWKLINIQYSDPNFKRIDFDVLVEANAAFYGDLNRIEISLDNIIRNAMVFADPAKVKPFVQIRVNVEVDDARLEIIDNGIGIAQHHVDQIFNMFYRASDKSRGAGLGLYIVKENMYQMKASISVESEFGFGSVFRIKIPNDLKKNITAG